MIRRKVVKSVQGQKAIDGAGVHVVRVLGVNDVLDFDPILMLDALDSTNPNDYIKGFPMHPHRGMETITYLVEGEMEHEDSLGNKGVIHSGESQWMTAGRGIMHQEKPKASPRMLSFQIWLNLPQSQKMIPPSYFDIKQEMMAVKEEDFGIVRVISGQYKDVKGVQPPHWNITLYDVFLNSGKGAVLTTNPEENVFVFLIFGNAEIDGENYPEKTAVLFDSGDNIYLKANQDCRFLFFSGKKIREPIAWGGPIVMNTQQELQDSFHELNSGTFIKN